MDDNGTLWTTDKPQQQKIGTRSPEHMGGMRMNCSLKLKSSLIACCGTLIALVVLGMTQRHERLCSIMEENDLRIPIGRALAANGMDEAKFNEVIDGVTTIYAPMVEKKGGALEVQKRWTDPTVNASAERFGETWVITMYGGLARHETVTPDGFALVVCHELGHHLGGAPKIAGWFGDWASNEGQSDYFATLRCLRRYFAKDDNEKIVDQMEIPPSLAEGCERTYPTHKEIAICKRAGMAGLSVSFLFYKAKNETTEPRFETPDPSQVGETDDDHPETQCRLDTYFQGSICAVPVPEGLDDGLSDSNPNQGTCYTGSPFEKGFRPRCWFATSR